MLCTAYRGGGVSDWFLPSRDELNLIYINLIRLNSVIDWKDSYWSSFYYSNGILDIGCASAQRFSDGAQITPRRNESYQVRAVRQF
ncbi:MAG: DUF1566 domain-containing protein [Treponema sp.]|nr:DUF1566 domain-containing protein [Treponema sp.]